jgi:hypothetical protein
LAEEGDDSAGKGTTAIEERRKQAAEDVHALSGLLNHANAAERKQGFAQRHVLDTLIPIHDT